MSFLMSSSLRSRLTLGAVFATTTAVLLGCSSGTQAGGGESVSPSASVSAAITPTPTPVAAYKPATSTGRAENVPIPALPEAAKANSKEGLEAFARYWYDLLNYGIETGDLKPIKAVTGPSCAMCIRVFPGIEKWNTDGRWIAGSRIQVQAASSKFIETTGGSYQVVVQSEQSDGTSHNPDGSLGQRLEASGVLGDLLIAKFVDGQWIVSNVDRLGSE